MTDEKILAFLNMGKNKAIDKSIMKIGFWMDFSISLFIITFGTLLKVFLNSTSDIIILSIIVVLHIIFAVWLFIAKNPTQAHIYSLVVSIIFIAKLIYGSVIFSQLKNETMSVWHVAVTVLFVTIALCHTWDRHKVFCELKTNSMEQVVKKIHKRNKGLRGVVIPVSTSASIVFVLSRFLTRHFEIGIGFLLWTLASILLFFVVGFLYNVIIIKKYKVADIFKNKTEDSSRS